MKKIQKDTGVINQNSKKEDINPKILLTDLLDFSFLNDGIYCLKSLMKHLKDGLLFLHLLQYIWHLPK